VVLPPSRLVAPNRSSCTPSRTVTRDMSTGSIMDDSDSADVVSVAPSTVSELSSFAAFNDTGNEAASASAAADGGESEFGIPEVTRHPLFWFDNDIVKVQVRRYTHRSMQIVLTCLALRLRTSRFRSMHTSSLVNPTREGRS
jgi:hypothetical protein